MQWIISANGNIYNHSAAFAKWGFIDWRQKANYSIGDIVYIYCTKPYQRIKYKTIVRRICMSSKDIVNDIEFWYDKYEYKKSLDGYYVRLELEEYIDSELLSIEYLRNKGLTGNIQGPRKLDNKIAEYVGEQFCRNWFPEEVKSNELFEGAVSKVSVNRYERNSISRQKCIEKFGCKCLVCGFDFEEIYGEIGKGFIHVHHVVPLYKIGKEYNVNYEKDLIPVCPNCHAMLHKKINGKNYSVADLKRILNKY